jgi:hypothetical protein
MIRAALRSCILQCVVVCERVLEWRVESAGQDGWATCTTLSAEPEFE